MDESRDNFHITRAVPVSYCAERVRTRPSGGIGSENLFGHLAELQNQANLAQERSYSCRDIATTPFRMHACTTLVLALCAASCFLTVSNAKIVNRYATKHVASGVNVNAPPQPVVVGDGSDTTGSAPDGTLISADGEHLDSSNPHGKHGHHGHREGDSHHGHVFGHEGHHHSKQNQLNKNKTPRLVAGARVKTKAPLDPEPSPDSGLCAAVKCKKRHVCLVNEAGAAECVHRKKQPRQNRRKQMKGAGVSPTAKDESKRVRNRKRLHIRKMAQQAKQEKKAHKMVKKIKNKAEHFKDRYEEKRHHRLHHLRQLASSGPEIHVEFVTGSPGLEHSAYSKQNMTISVLQHCSPRELTTMGRQLLESFKANQDKNPNHHDHTIQKRNSMKKELHEKDECICQAPVRYEFLTLDADEDDVLSVRELGHLRSPAREHCVQPFIETCDHDLDGRLSSKEWCCCFADVLPPCLADMTMVPAAMSAGGPAVMPGAMVPQCDSDGFYKPMQCHGSTGYCWCVDQSGKHIEGTNTRGTPDCDKLVENPVQEENSQELEAQ